MTQTLSTGQNPKNNSHPAALKPEWLNKSTMTNLVSLGVAAAGYLLPWQQDLLKSAGLFALSGAITNWLAIHMLFEKVPGLYGSGVIPARFTEFKEGIQSLIMTQFFTEENISRFFNGEDGGGLTQDINLKPLLGAIDYENLFEKLINAVKSSPLGPMLAMFGGDSALEPVREPFINKMKEALEELSQSPKLQHAIRTTMKENLGTQTMMDQVSEIVRRRLEELTPSMVKDIIQDMIRQHLGWLVVWGGVFGGLLGILAHFIS